MRGQFRGKTFMVRGIHKYQIKSFITRIDVCPGFGLNNDRDLFCVYGLEVLFNEIDTFSAFVNECYLGSSSAYRLNPQTAATGK